MKTTLIYNEKISKVVKAQVAAILKAAEELTMGKEKVEITQQFSRCPNDKGTETSSSCMLISHYGMVLVLPNFAIKGSSAIIPLMKMGADGSMISTDSVTGPFNHNNTSNQQLAFFLTHPTFRHSHEKNN